MSIKVFRANGEEIPLQTFKFPGGEVQVKLNLENFAQPWILNIEAYVQNSDDILTLLLVTDAIKRASEPRFPPQLHLVLPYVPYGRQDRVMSPGEALSVKVFADLINAQKYDSVLVYDPHSDVTPALLERCVVMPQEKLLKMDLDLIIGPLLLDKYKDSGMAQFEAVKQAEQDCLDNIVLVSPDAGANKKIFKVAQHCGFKHVVRADKNRDVATGQITGTVVYSEHVGNKDFLIVDDIIDGARTFVELAKVLRPLTDGKIILYATHGIFSKGLGVFKGLIDEVYCTHSFGKYPYGENLMELVK